MKWLKLSISIAICGLIYILIDRWQYRSTDPVGMGFTLFFIFLIIWGALTILTPTIIVLRLRNIIPKTDSFFYIFLAVANLFVAVIGWHALWYATVKNVPWYAVAVGLNAVMGGWVGWNWLRV